MDVCELLRKKIGIAVAEKVKGWPVQRYLGELQKSQWLTPQQVKEIQNEKLARVIAHAYDTVAYYRNVMDERGLKPEDIKTVGDLQKLPILTKDMFRASYPDQMLSSSFDARELVEMSSSGSTGEPFKYLISEDEKARKWAGLYRIWSWAGYEMGDRYASLTAFIPHAFKERGFWRSLESRCSGVLGLPANDLYTGNADEFARMIIDFKPRMLRGYASSIYYLAEVMSRTGVKLDVKNVQTTGETLFDFQRELIESFYGCKVHDGYGGEGMEIAGQCDDGSGYHLNAENLVLEVVDSNGAPCVDGVEGQIVLTDLNRYSMPFIRYNIQDLAVRSDRLCACGRGLPMLDRISGRLTDIGVTPSGKSIVVHFFTVMFMKLAPRVRGFQVVQEQPDLFVLYVVPGEGFKEVRDEILSKTSDHVGIDVTVELRTVEHIPSTPGGKRRLFVSKCGIKAAGG